ncbi:carboxylesterase [Marinilabilia salmonicolor]|jgi:pimeloyl-ACP methyl ester carboxylesterase|uniref:Esterase/lipase n=1 Tax=Marinilabilia salmonicolor TaxID=989 RepID=A0A368V100_9BACT|nr:alpha/beta fold hydrolase [Marinilabilia salmonicolor]RCW33960.1 esterase/lipase [Marinilabilia salmonicolor]
MKTSVKKTFWLYLVPILFVIWYLGPQPETPNYHTDVPKTPSSPVAADSFLKTHEANYSVKPENEARIIWADDSLKSATKYVVVYLHGFGASQREGAPVHRRIARKYGCNLLLTRLADHGLSNDVNLDQFSVQRLWNSTLESLSIARALGDKIILMGTSTGGTLALKMASLFDYVEALILLSPNVRVRDNNAWILNNRWGLPLAKVITGSDKMVSDEKEDWYPKYWYPEYGLEAVAELQELIETTMVPDVFRQVTQPVLLLYYYQDEVHQDSVVSVQAMLDMYRQLGTTDSLKQKIAFPDAGNHVIGCDLRSGDVEGVYRAVVAFLEENIN